MTREKWRRLGIPGPQEVLQHLQNQQAEKEADEKWERENQEKEDVNVLPVQSPDDKDR